MGREGTVGKRPQSDIEAPSGTQLKAQSLKWARRIAIAVVVTAIALFSIRMCTSIQENEARAALGDQAAT